MNKRSRKTKGLAHRLFALLLCCACLMAVVPAYAIASEAGTVPTETVTVAVDPTEAVSVESETQATTAPTVAEETTETTAATENTIPATENTLPAETTSPTEETVVESEVDKLYARLMGYETLDELNAAIEALTEEEKALLEQFTDEQNAALEAKIAAWGGYGVATLENRQYTIVQGESKDVSVSNLKSGDFKYTSTQDGITAKRKSSSAYTISVGTSVPAGGPYTLMVSYRAGSGYVTTYSDTVTIYVKKVPVHVYVSSEDSNGNSWLNNTEFQDLIGLYVCDDNRYFPAGTIELDASYFTGKTGVNTPGYGLINNANDWATLRSLLSNMNNNNMSGTLGAWSTSNGKPLDFSSNNGNKVSEYLSQAIVSYNSGWGSQSTALFRWHLSYDPNDAGQAHLGHPGDTTTRYHLDLCFNTNKITFICGNNGITSGTAADGTRVDERVYITGSAIQPPRNLNIPAGYKLVGYYTDADFNTPWNGIGTPLNKDQTVYIKITKEENVILHYAVADGDGIVTPDSEGLNPVIGKAVGSTAKPADGWAFEGWYADKECTKLLSKDATYAPTKKDDERWINGTTYYAKFVKAEVELTIKKIVTGNMGDQNKEFTFTVSGTSVKDTDKNFKLKHNGEQKITVKVGDEITITEEDAGYDASYVIGSDDSKTGNSVTYKVTADENQVITFTNRKDVTIDNGITLDFLPYFLILAAVAAGGVMLTRKRRFFED